MPPLILSGLLNPQPVWAELIFLVTFVTIVLAVVVALFGSRQRRAARASFALAASAYLAITLYPGNFENFPTSRLFRSLDERIAPIRNRDLTPTPQPGAGGMGGGMFALAPSHPAFNDQALAFAGYRNMPRIGHCAFAMLLGLLAAIVGQLAHTRHHATGGDS